MTWVYISVELRVSGCYGAFLAGPESHCVAMAALDWHTALAFEFTHGKSLDETRGVAIQVRTGVTWQLRKGERILCIRDATQCHYLYLLSAPNINIQCEFGFKSVGGVVSAGRFIYLYEPNAPETLEKPQYSSPHSFSTSATSVEYIIRSHYSRNFRSYRPNGFCMIFP